MHDELWAGVEFKLQSADLHLRNMGQSLQPPARTGHNVAIQSMGTIIDTRWQISFYAYVDAFLSATRSVPEVIKCCFGYDANSVMAQWFNRLSAEEQARRKEFSRQFKLDYEKFCRLPLGTARHISQHRTGYAPVSVKISTLLGVTYTGGPITLVPASETRHIPVAELQFLAKPSPIQPTWTDFTLDGEGLFPACRAYIGSARDLVVEARQTAAQVHGHKALTPPE
jgi:hypothetical protein